MATTPVDALLLDTNILLTATTPARLLARLAAHRAAALVRATVSVRRARYPDRLAQACLVLVAVAVIAVARAVAVVVLTVIAGRADLLRRRRRAAVARAGARLLVAVAGLIPARRLRAAVDGAVEAVLATLAGEVATARADGRLGAAAVAAARAAGIRAADRVVADAA